MLTDQLRGRHSFAQEKIEEKNSKIESEINYFLVGRGHKLVLFLVL